MNLDQAALKSAALRAIRTFVQAFLAVWGVPQILGWLSGSQPLDVGAARAALVAGVAAVIAWLWRTFLDPSPIPSLNDDNVVATPAVKP